MPELDQINENLGALTSANQEIQDQMIMRDRRLSQELCQDLSALSATLVQIQEARACINGICSLKEYNGVITPFGPSASNQGQVNPTGNGKHFQIQARGDQHAAWILHSEATKGSDKRPLMISNIRHCR